MSKEKVLLDALKVFARIDDDVYVNSNLGKIARQALSDYSIAQQKSDEDVNGDEIVYVLTNVLKRVPEKDDKMLYVLLNGTYPYVSNYKNKHWSVDSILSQVTHWLKPVKLSELLEKYASQRTKTFPEVLKWALSELEPLNYEIKQLESINQQLVGIKELVKQYEL